MSVRQEKFAGLIQEHLADIFMRHKEYVSGVFVTISRVQVSPDLGYAKIYLSLFKAPDKNLLLETLKLHAREIRKQLASKIKNQVRVIPELEFFVDDSLDYVFHMEEVFKEINKQDEKRNQNKE
ncbi:MAG: 30S ribosome-binding factor RbfA [Bacteroidetes bacterium]|nr:30S ribosome-binding factor RbfA [Bacteroidota bacterium]MCK6612252.1 30S ribosome-binding factor RbfA [Bacteroidia bacterium]